MTSELRVTTISNTNGTDPVTLTKQSASKTFAHFDQSTPTLGASLNISSSTDTTTGDFTLNFTSAYAAHTDRAVVGAAVQSGVRKLLISGPDDSATGSCRMVTFNTSGTSYDANRSGVVIQGDLA